MHEDLQIDDTFKSNGILHRGELIYYVGSFIFGAGIVLLLIGTAFVMIFEIHSKSDPGEIVLTTVLVALGIALILIGINMMIRQTKYGKYIMIASSLMSLIAVLIFALNYYRNWYYPIISYIIALYVTGFSMLVGNAFANITAWMIHGKTEIVTSGEDKAKIYTDEEIQRDIEEATRKSMELAASELQFEIGGMENIKIGKAFHESRGTVTRVKDDMDESLTLKQTISPGETEKWGSIGIDKDSIQLSKALEDQKAEKRKYIDIKERVKKGWGKITNFLRSK